MSTSDGDDNSLSEGETPEYVVGRGKPPKEHQFKKGESGNKGGRPKKPIDPFYELQKIMNKEVTLSTDSGEEVRITKAQAFFEKMWERSLSGDKEAQRIILEMLNKDHQKYITENDPIQKLFQNDIRKTLGLPLEEEEGDLPEY
jgi:Family of unknown function (DUF5681)